MTIYQTQPKQLNTFLVFTITEKTNQIYCHHCIIITKHTCIMPHKLNLLQSFNTGQKNKGWSQMPCAVEYFCSLIPNIHKIHAKHFSYNYFQTQHTVKIISFWAEAIVKLLPTCFPQEKFSFMYSYFPHLLYFFYFFFRTLRCPAVLFASCKILAASP